jgi:hypothetical protein
VHLGVLQLAGVAFRLDQHVKDVHAFFFALLQVVVDGHVFGAVGQVLHASAHRLFRHVCSPFGVVVAGVLKNKNKQIDRVFSPRLSSTHVLAGVLAGGHVQSVVLVVDLAGVAVGLSVGALASLRSLAFGQRRSLHGGIQVRRVLQDESDQLVVRLQVAVITASLAALRDGAALGGDQQLGFRVVALGTQNESEN